MIAMVSSDRGSPPSLLVAHVVLSLDCGGLERVVLDLIRGGAAVGQRTAVIGLERPGVLATEAERSGAAIVCLSKRPGIRPGVIDRVKSTLRELRPDVVHTHQIGALFYAGPAAKGVGIPSIVHTEHGKHFDGRFRTRLLGQLAGRYAAKFFCVSADIASEVLAHRIVPRRKIHVVPNGIDTARFAGHGDAGPLRQSLGIPAGAAVVGTVGRLDVIKRQDLLIRAFVRVGQRISEPHLLLVGDGPLLRDLRELASGLGLLGRVHFVGYQAEPERYLRMMDVFALTSRSEGMPLAVLEAWAAGIPVIASRVGGLPEMIDDGRTGVLFDSGDEDALVEALCGLLTDAGRAGRIGEAGRLRVESLYSLRRMVESYRCHYLELIDSAPPLLS
ncbi:MAG: glycosyltransferase [Singulisphaera sp.]|nr:glycosyltransferase [Singulisphaera sp.]